MEEDKKLELLELENEMLKSQNQKLLSALIETQEKLKEWLEHLERSKRSDKKRKRRKG